MPKRRSPATIAIHPREDRTPGPVVTPIVMSSTFRLRDARLGMGPAPLCSGGRIAQEEEMHLARAVDQEIVIAEAAFVAWQRKQRRGLAPGVTDVLRVDGHGTLHPVDRGQSNRDESAVRQQRGLVEFVGGKHGEGRRSAMADKGAWLRTRGLDGSSVHRP